MLPICMLVSTHYERFASVCCKSCIMARKLSNVLLNMPIPKHFASFFAVIALEAAQKKVQDCIAKFGLCHPLSSVVQLRVLLGLVMVVAASPACQTTCFDR